MPSIVGEATCTPTLGRGHAARDDERSVVGRKLRHPSNHLAFRRFDDGARHEDVGVGLRGRGGDRVPVPGEGLLHETGLAVILGAAVRLDVHLHGATNARGVFSTFRGYLSRDLCRSSTYNSYAALMYPDREA